MPRVKTPKTPPTLQDSCIKFVVENMIFWCKQSTNDLYKMGPELGSNPFDSLSGLVLQEIAHEYYSSIESSKCYISGKRDNCLQHLITPQLIGVLLPYDQETVQLASIRCPKLKKLMLQDTFYSDMSFFPKFENLEVLDISITPADDSFLNTLGTFCTNLRVLNLEDCKLVTDRGIQGLCMSVDSLGRANDTLGRCKALQSLNLIDTGVTKKGLQMALENMLALKNLMHISIVEALAEMALNVCESNLPELALSTLENEHYDEEVSYQSGNLELALSLCPLITVVDLVIYETREFHDKDLLSLRSLKRMKELYIFKKKMESSILLDNRIQAVGEITFGGGLAPVLKVIGSSLTTLNLSGFHDVNVLCIIECCPNLEYLKLEKNYSYASSCPEKVQKSVIQKQGNEQPILKKLCALCIRIVCPYDGVDFSTCNNFIQSEILVILLSSPLLKEIDMYNCETLTDDVMLAVAKVNNFKQIEELSFVNCRLVTEKSIGLFMHDDNALKKIYIYGKKISKRDEQRWKNQAIQKNWDLTIEVRRW